MIYTSDDYISKYQEVLCYLLSYGIKNKLSFSYIQKTICSSEVIKQFERSNITLIAFSSCQINAKQVYRIEDVYLDPNDNYGLCGWLSTVYIHLFLKLKITFEGLFYLLPIEEGIKCYSLYHEMDITQMDKYIEEKTNKTMLDIIMETKKVSSQSLANHTDISFYTINALRYGKRDIKKLESYKVILIANYLDVFVETIVGSLPLSIK